MILYGASHSAIESKLQHPWITEQTLSFFPEWYTRISKRELNEVREIVLGEENFVYHDSGLF